MMMYVMLIVGFVLLIKGADFFVEGSSSVAKLLHIPSVVIGLTVVAFGTSAPELAVSMAAALTGNNEIAVGNVVGSNLFNLLVVTGACSAIMPMAIDKGILYRDFLFSIFISFVFLFLIAFDHQISRTDGLILLVLFGYFIWKTVKNALKSRMSQDEQITSLTSVRSAGYIIAGLIAIVVGGDVVVESASKIAAAFGLSQTLIGLTIVAMGTSLPELVTSIVAAKKRENGLALGNVIGSNIFNILLILGASSVISPIVVSIISVFDLLCLITFSIVTWILARGRFRLDRFEGIFMIMMYLAYTGYIIFR